MWNVVVLLLKLSLFECFHFWKNKDHEKLCCVFLSVLSPVNFTLSGGICIIATSKSTAVDSDCTSEFLKIQNWKIRMEEGASYDVLTNQVGILKSVCRKIFLNI